jgi:ribonuclease D
MSGPTSRPLLITDAISLTTFLKRHAAERRLALDTEAASFHRYVDRVYLIQISTDRETALVDPLTVEDLSPIGAVLADPAVEVILHDADYDLRTLNRDYGFRGRRLWDTRVAAQLAGETAFGLAALLEKFFGVRLSKQLQRADWSERPLTEAMIAYAAADTAHLPALRDLLAERLSGLGRQQWAEEEFLRLEDVRWGPRAAAGEEYLGLKGASALRPLELAVLRALWTWRDEEARRLDRAPFRVAANEVLVATARALPDGPASLAAVPDMPPGVARRHGSAMLEAVRAGRATPPADRPRIERRPRERPDPIVDERMARLKALRATRAPAVGLDPGLICPNGTLFTIARTAPRSPADLDAVPDLRRWQREVMGDAALLAAIEQNG